MELFNLNLGSILNATLNRIGPSNLLGPSTQQVLGTVGAEALPEIERLLYVLNPGSATEAESATIALSEGMVYSVYLATTGYHVADQTLEESYRFLQDIRAGANQSQQQQQPQYYQQPQQQQQPQYYQQPQQQQQIQPANQHQPAQQQTTSSNMIPLEYEPVKKADFKREPSEIRVNAPAPVPIARVTKEESVEKKLALRDLREPPGEPLSGDPVLTIRMKYPESLTEPTLVAMVTEQHVPISSLDDDLPLGLVKLQKATSLSELKRHVLELEGVFAIPNLLPWMDNFLTVSLDTILVHAYGADPDHSINSCINNAGDLETSPAYSHVWSDIEELLMENFSQYMCGLRSVTVQVSEDAEEEDRLCLMADSTEYVLTVPWNTQLVKAKDEGSLPTATLFSSSCSEDQLNWLIDDAFEVLPDSTLKITLLDSSRAEFIVYNNWVTNGIPSNYVVKRKLL